MNCWGYREEGGESYGDTGCAEMMWGGALKGPFVCEGLLAR